jgi:hypothetical protein
MKGKTEKWEHTRGKQKKISEEGTNGFATRLHPEMADDNRGDTSFMSLSYHNDPT